MTQITTRTMFTDTQIKKVAGKDTKMVTYPNLKKFKTIDEVYKKKKNVIILYIHE